MASQAQDPESPTPEVQNENLEEKKTSKKPFKEPFKGAGQEKIFDAIKKNYHSSAYITKGDKDLAIGLVSFE